MGARFITLGDVRGVGPDLVLQAAAEYGSPFDAVVVGSPEILARRAAQLKLPNYNGEIFEPENSPDNPIAQPGAAAISYLEYSLSQLNKKSKKAGLLVTCPINKATMQKAGFQFPGHTEFLKNRAGVPRVFMLMINKKLKLILTTIHEPLSKVPELLTRQKVTQTIKASVLILKNDFNLDKPIIGVAGFKPHSGEQGNYGTKETEDIKPAIDDTLKWLSKNSIQAQILGPYPPDTIFWEAQQGKLDFVVTMYHDQGLIAVKTTDIHSTVNFTAGLPFIRTSPDHGTAFSLAGTGKTDPGSFMAAWELGLKLQNNRIENSQ
ncbi:MAG: 4-hydroxythreonine-4-phosphate dehydrogenase PdxA [Deltaproteobacteria bacterium]|jgi:4-hydroxythreonine-4-phosphate dehydrogenase|nr:4-hydroxythreonine-4-phosphate dehydrogenase PdxA [Deltaproteobacteria bacterium]